MTARGTLIVCWCCGVPGSSSGAFELTEACYSRWLRAGKPKSGPPPRNPEKGKQARTEGLRRAKEMRLQRYLQIRDDCATQAEAAAQLGVSLRTIWSYEQEIKARERAARVA
ncbi:hypothetical protein Ppa06_57780 [Planomonospora parontospora subsp. parontospora]|uniref:Uncharacterized protein n=2 Tax=Planomonospora parontospora TaxID=58119 RepID=A0AA37F767_9ACTN|nr:hypothetical protein [Planomonospora parontospora]GGK90582.1 hypothetical protein GCM10010126_57530 [Planomonospora parontospora]GII11980.1 hypothetical protein Ppa06_57780 [Planomonospora parontospora subsp. parontospora]